MVECPACKGEGMEKARFNGHHDADDFCDGFWLSRETQASGYEGELARWLLWSIAYTVSTVGKLDRSFAKISRQYRESERTRLSSVSHLSCNGYARSMSMLCSNFCKYYTMHHPVPPTSHHVSMMDIFFPGFTGATAALHQLLDGNLDSYASLLCICGLLTLT
ncbi:hypothetical protein CCUS01_16242 [Colletotrichum cuscutae]|uniref:Uncharacterized protein n=1 Tax=Colletotrichum cuscutae TaxID=1209917 RepID=A0AAI9VEM2_9PEZI|nr:hypothetical protein CCUS01_16242 [Colletotrichum cuscutae]